MAKTMEEVLERFRTIEFHDDFDMIVAMPMAASFRQASSISVYKKKCICCASI